ncbi:MAG: CCA tRNA nucleotidyltransferase [Geminicoccaceae bacterium]
MTADGHQARFVGGCVRDSLLGRFVPGGDIDLATPLLPDQIIARLESTDIKAIPTGIAHGTVTAVLDGQTFEVTTLRQDLVCDGRHAEVRFTDDFMADAARRDFTINAMSADRHGRLFDYFAGWEDLKAGRIRFVGDATRRVEEDYLRILRFFRFFAGYGLPPADPAALEACRRRADGLAKLSGERIQREILKLLSAENPIPSLSLMLENKILEHILPSTHNLEPLTRLITSAPDSSPLIRLAALLRSNTDPKSTPSAVADNFRLSRAEATRLERLTTEPLLDLPASPKTVRRDLYRLGKETYLDLLKLSATTPADLDAASPLPSISAMPLRGDDLVERGVPPGPGFGALLRQIENWWLDHDMQPDRTACLAELDRHLAENQA